MKKIFKGLLCATAVMSMAFANVQGVFAADTAAAAYEITTDKTTVNANDEFVVTVSVKNNPGINAVTATLNYDAALVQPVSAVDVTDAAFSLMTTDEVNQQINLKPSATNSDYTGLGADGTKTAAQLGKVKVAGYLTEGNNLVQSTKDGAFLAFKFKTVATSTAATKISFNNIKTSGFNGTEVTDVTIADGFASVAFEGGSSVDPTPGTYTHVAGDFDNNGSVTASDAALVIKDTLLPSADRPTNSDADLKVIADVNGDGNVTAQDAAEIIKKTLSPGGSYVFKVGDKVTVTDQKYAQ